ncbi:MAG: HAMP domain-containing histidine kinase [Planctomycetes bacterium]|nr:HAMP domain-containing histidine kinase [Planctomycetota bacterium]
MKSSTTNLRTKILVYFTGLFVLLSIVIITSLNYLLSGILYKTYKDRGTQMIQLLSTEFIPLAYYDDIASIDGHFKQRQSSFPEVRYIIISNKFGDTIWSTFKEGIPSDLSSKQPNKLLTGDIFMQKIKTTDKDFIYDYQITRSGITSRLGLSLYPVSRTINQIIFYVVCINIVGLIFIFVFAIYISRPIELLAEMISRNTLPTESFLNNRQNNITKEAMTITSRFQEVATQLAERTKQLNSTKKMAYLGEISAIISHEINNPLGIIAMNSDFLLKRLKSGELNPDTAKEIDRLNKASRRAILAVSKLLQFACYSSHTSVSQQYELIDLNFIVDETIDLLSDRIQLSGCTIENNIKNTHNLPPIYGEVQGIQQVIFNLLTNAIDASKKGGNIVIRAFVSDQGLLSVQIQDDGLGMSEEVAKHAKEPFFTTKKAGTGTGLGLAISDSIINKHGGHITIESKPNIGTTVTINIPIQVTEMKSS